MLYPLPTEIIASVSHPQLILDEQAKQGRFTKNQYNRLLSYSGGFSIVFQFEKDGKKYAFRCWHKDPGQSVNYQKYLAISQYISSTQCDYFLPFSYNPEGIIISTTKFPTLTMEWSDDKLLKEFIAENLTSTVKLQTLAYELEQMFVCLHQLRIAHGDLQHGNILVTHVGRPVLIDYDSVYVPYLNGEKATIAGYENYQHPARKQQELLTEQMDYFSEVIIVLSVLGIALKPELWYGYRVKDTEGLLFSKADFQNFTASKVYTELKALQNDRVDFLLKTLIDFLYEKDISKLRPVWKSDAYFKLSASLVEGVIPLTDYLSLQTDLKSAYQTIQQKDRQLKKMKDDYVRALEELRSDLEKKHSRALEDMQEKFEEQVRQLQFNNHNLPNN